MDGIERGKKLKLMLYVFPIGSILITLWTSNFQNEYLTENSSCMTEINYE